MSEQQARIRSDCPEVHPSALELELESTAELNPRRQECTPKIPLTYTSGYPSKWQAHRRTTVVAAKTRAELATPPPSKPPSCRPARPAGSQARRDELGAVAELVRRDDALLQGDSGECCPLLVLRHVGDAERFKEGVEVELDRFDAQ